MDGCLVISKHFPCKDLVHHPIETTIYKWMFGVPGNHLKIRPTLTPRTVNGASRSDECRRRNRSKANTRTVSWVTSCSLYGTPLQKGDFSREKWDMNQREASSMKVRWIFFLIVFWQFFLKCNYTVDG